MENKQQSANEQENIGFLHDLDDYFSKKYADFDLISSVPSYQSVTVSMILKNKNRIEEGEYAANEMRKIAYQPDPAAVLAEVKQKYVDNTFTFNFRPAPFGTRLKALFGSKNTAGGYIKKLVSNYGDRAEGLYERLGMAEKDWNAVLRGFYIPEKVLVYKLTLLLGLSQTDNLELMKACGCFYDFADARDVVVRYLVDYRVYNRDMINKAFDEYNIRRIL